MKGSWSGTGIYGTHSIKHSLSFTKIKKEGNTITLKLKEEFIEEGGYQYELIHFIMDKAEMVVTSDGRIKI